MSKEMKMAEQHELLSYAVQIAKNVSNVECLQKGGKPSNHWGRVLLHELGRLKEENKALREQIQIEESECDALRSEVDRLCEIINELGDSDEQQAD